MQLKENKEISVIDFCLLIYSAKGIRVSIIDLRPFIKYFIKEENRLTLKGKVEKMNLVEGEYSVGLYYFIDQTRRELLDINQIIVKPALQVHEDVKPYLSQYRGYLELINNIKVD